jgi:glycosyltransferase involved in cell wall biosynthesis
MSCTVLSQYPFSQAFSQKLESHLGQSPTYMSLAELRDMPVGHIWRRLRSIKSESIVIPLEDNDARAVLPFLKLLAGVSSARKIHVIGADLSQVPASRWSLFSDLISISKASLRGGVAAASARRAFASLMRTPRIATVLSRSMRVLYINTNLWFGVKAGGSIGHVAGVVNGLTKVGYHVDYASPAENVMISSMVTRLNLRHPSSFGLPLENTQYSYDASATHQIKRMVKAPYGFIYQRMSLANFTGVKLSRALLVPYVVEYNGSEAWAAKNWGRPLKDHNLAVRAEDVCLKHAHVVVTISEVLEQELRSRGVEKDRIVCYPNCIDEELFNPQRFGKAETAELRERYGIKSEAVVVGFIGTFGLWHGADILAQAIHKLVSEESEWIRKSKVHFLLMGDGAKMPLVREALREERSPYWTLTGLIPQSHAPLHLAATDILVSPHVPNPDGSRFFGSPTKLFEYMAMGKTIVASDLDQIGQVLCNSLRSWSLPDSECMGDEKSLAILSRPGNINDLIKGIKFAVDHPGWRSLLADNVAREALTKYTWTIHVEKILAKLHQVEGEKRSVRQS